MEPTPEFIRALNKFHQDYMKGCPVVESTLPGFLDPRNELILAVFRFASREIGWIPPSA